MQTQTEIPVWQEKIMFEKIPALRADLGALRHYFETEILAKYPPVWQDTFDKATGAIRACGFDDASARKVWGGWSVSSFNGSYASGWEPAFLTLTANKGNAPDAFAFQPEHTHTLPTEVCRGPVAELLRSISRAAACRG